MSDSELFRKYAEEAMVASVASKDENEKRILDELTGMWGKAATVSERIFTSPHSLRLANMRQFQLPVVFYRHHH
jgi:hypothetical protein